MTSTATFSELNRYDGSDATELGYAQLKDALRPAKDAGLTAIRLNSKATDLRAEYTRLEQEEATEFLKERRILLEELDALEDVARLSYRSMQEETATATVDPLADAVELAKAADAVIAAQVAERATTPQPVAIPDTVAVTVVTALVWMVGTFVLGLFQLPTVARKGWQGGRKALTIARSITEGVRAPRMALAMIPA